ncbi:hypothetical protein SDC9_133888 [bioreactor metagenome]|uniref:Uncharacterized protein n=1 Tax=bioreactor metagenome TaxID=1076179 RepID=A0A645DBH5_9ZZZZ
MAGRTAGGLGRSAAGPGNQFRVSDRAAVEPHSAGTVRCGNDGPGAEPESRREFSGGRIGRRATENRTRDSDQSGAGKGRLRPGRVDAPGRSGKKHRDRRQSDARRAVRRL